MIIHVNKNNFCIGNHGCNVVLIQSKVYGVSHQTKIGFSFISVTIKNIYWNLLQNKFALYELQQH